MNLIALLYFAVAVAIAPLAAASADASSFEVRVTGSGRPMILIPGLACPGAVWDSTVARFSNQYECHIISIAGFGGTPAQPGEGLLLERVRNEDSYRVLLRNGHRVLLSPGSTSGCSMQANSNGDRPISGISPFGRCIRLL